MVLDDSSNEEHQRAVSEIGTNLPADGGLYLCHISIHGLIRGHDLELGRDADTGGQTKYVVELIRALSERPEVARVDLLTRLVDDQDISEDYAKPLEPLGERAQIVRIEAGPASYIPKEQLWDHLDSFVDNAIAFLGDQPRQPDLLHSHYADAGYVGSRMSHVLGIPLVHTGHSLGRVKRGRLLASGVSAADIESRFNMSRRIEAEENTLASAERVITSTRQEVDEQYGLYDVYQPDRMRVIPPGTDLTRFHPPEGSEWHSEIAATISRFLREPEKPMILTLSRPDPRKNITSLVSAYASSATIQEMANLVIVAGNRDTIEDLDQGARDVLSNVLWQIDRFDLYGKVAYPKQHAPEDVPRIFRLAAMTGGVFVNPALTEPFGLTLIEAAASGLPILATEDGGPRDIIENCQNGRLVNPLDPDDIARGIEEVLSNWESWQKRSLRGLDGVRAHYSWEAHADTYLECVSPIVERTEAPLTAVPRVRRPLLYHDRAIFTDLDECLLTDPDSLPALAVLIRDHHKDVTFGIVTGRRLDSALSVMKRYDILEPHVLITSCGTAIHYAPELTEDTSWTRHIEKQWTPRVIRRLLDPLPGLERQPPEEQSPFKISYFIDPAKAPTMEEINHLLYQEEQSTNVILSFGQFLDVLPLRASKGLALRYVAARWDIPLDRILVASGSGADEDMLRGNTLAVVVGERHREGLSKLAELERVYFAKTTGPRGILEAIRHYRFFEDLNTKSDASK